MINVLVKDTNEVIGFPDTTDKNTIEQVVNGDLHGEITEAKPNWYRDKIEPILRASKMDMFQPKFVGAQVEPDANRAFITIYAKEASIGLLDSTKEQINRESIEQNPVASLAGSLVGQTQAILTTAGLGKAIGFIGAAPKLTQFGEAIVNSSKVGLLYGAMRKGVEEINRSIDENTYPDLIRIGEAALKDAGVFAVYGGVGAAIPSRPVSTAAIAGTAYTISKMEGASEEDALLNAGVMGAFHFISSADHPPEVKKAVLENVTRMKADYIKATTPQIADTIVDRAAQEHTMTFMDENPAINTKDIIGKMTEDIIGGEFALEPRAEGLRPEDYATAEEYVASKVEPDTSSMKGRSPEVNQSRLIQTENTKSYADIAKVKPDEMVTVWRAVPKGGNIEAGDFIAVDKEIAKSYGSDIIRRGEANEVSLNSLKVKASEVRLHPEHQAQGVENEFIYRPEGSITKSQLTAEWEAAQGEERALNSKAWQKEMPLEPETDKTVNKSQIVKFVEDNFNVAVRGKATKRMGKAAGTYAIDKNLIRLKKWGELEVLAHESAHSISEDIRDGLGLHGIRQILPPAIEKVAADELKRMDYDPSKGRTEEGFAEYVRHWLTRTGETKYAPEFDKYFNNQFMKDHPEFGKSLVKLREMFDIWYGQGAEKRIMAQVDKTGEHTTKLTGVAANVEKAREWFVQKFINDLYTIEKIEKIVRPEGMENVRPTQSPSQLARYSRAKSGAIARTFVLEGAINEAGVKIGKSLKEALDPIARKDVDKFMSYAVARRAQLYHERGFESGFDKNDVNYIIEKYRNPEWDKAIDDVTIWSNHLLNWVVRAGGISPETAGVIRELNPIYLPFKRAFSNEIKVTQGGGKMVNQGQAVKSIKGSGRPIINPIESMIAQAQEMVNKAQKLRIARSLALLAREKDAGGFITEVPAPKGAHEVTVEQAVQRLGDMGVIFKDADFSNVNAQDVLTFFENKPIYNGKDNIISIWMNGKRKFYEVHPELYEALNGIDPLRVGPVMRVLGGFSRIVRLGATQLKVSFSLIRNPFRDAFSYAVFSNRPGATIFDPIKGVYKDLTAKEGDLAKRFKNVGGEMSSMMGYDRSATMHSYDLLLDEKLKGFWGKSLKVAKHPVNAIREVLQVPELGPRIAELENTYNRVRKEHPDWTDEDAFIAAFNDAQDVTVNFTRSGAWGRQINEAAAFFNASMQGTDKLARSIKDHPVRTIVKGAAYLSTLAVWSYMANKDKEWYQNLPPAYKYNNIFIEAGNSVVRLPIPFELGTIFYSSIQAGLDYAATHDKEYIDSFLKNFSGQLPDPVPTAIQPLIDVGTNTNFLGQPIESDGMKFDPVEDRKRDNTSKVAEYLSAGMRSIGLKDLSPVEMEYLMNAYSGGMTKSLSEVPRTIENVSEGDVKPEDIPVLADVLLRNKNNPTRQLNKFFADYELLSQKNHAKTLTPEESSRYKSAQNIYNKLVGSGKKTGIFRKIKQLRDEKNEDGINELLKLEREILSNGGYD